jgi:hypothetical protein
MLSIDRLKAAVNDSGNLQLKCVPVFSQLFHGQHQDQSESEFNQTFLYGNDGTSSRNLIGLPPSGAHSKVSFTNK